MRVLGVIPARKGSKGLPRKNMLPLAGKPLLAYSVEAALAAPSLAEVFVTTDDDEVLAAAGSYGLSVDYRRPARLAADETGMYEVVADALDWLAQRGRAFDAFVLLQPTSPFRTSRDIENAIAMLARGDTPSVVGVSPMWTHPNECVSIVDGTWSYLVPPPIDAKRRQDYRGEYAFINGAIYCVLKESFLAEKRFLFSSSKFLMMHDANTVDIDSERDFVIAEALLARGLIPDSALST